MEEQERVKVRMEAVCPVRDFQCADMTEQAKRCEAAFRLSPAIAFSMQTSSCRGFRSHHRRDHAAP